MAKISVALSGGGHRASLFALGTLQYLADAEMNKEVVSIASVSGGSLTNGYVGQNVRYDAVSGAVFQAEVSDPFLKQITTKGTFFAPLITKLYIALLVVVALASLVGPWFLTSLGFGWRLLICVVGIVITLALAWLRGPICRHAFRVTLFSPAGSATKVADMNAGVDHLLCSTDLQSGDHFYFARDLAYGYQFGIGTPGDTDLATAAGASAALPGAFTPVTVKTSNLGFTGGNDGAGASRLHLVDGGVYDNMGDQWAVGYERRLDRLPPAYKDRVPDQLVAVNASSGADWTKTSMLDVPIVGEIKALLRDKSILYDNTTAHRRVALIDRFKLAKASGNGLNGTYVGINQSPYLTAKAFVNDPDFGPRAQAVLDMLNASTTSEADWDQVTEASDKMSTNLSRIGSAVAGDVVWHSYVLAMCNLHVILGFPISMGIPDRNRFRT